MWIMLLLFTTISFADDMSSEKYCFPTPSRAEIAKQKFSLIQVPSDVAGLDENCLVIQMRSHRRELIQRYILSTFADANVSFSSEDTRRDPCKLKVEKEKLKTTDDLDISLQRNQGHIIKIDSNSASNEVMMIETTKNFELTVDQDEIKGICRSITPDRYIIEIEVRKNPKPIIPEGLPRGSVIVLNQTPPPQQDISVIKSEIQLQRGQRINLGDVVKNIKNESRSVDLRPELSGGNTNQTSKMAVFLSLQ